MTGHNNSASFNHKNQKHLYITASLTSEKEKHLLLLYLRIILASRIHAHAFIHGGQSVFLTPLSREYSVLAQVLWSTVTRLICYVTNPIGVDPHSKCKTFLSRESSEKTTSRLE